LAIKEILKGTIEVTTVFYIFSSTVVFALLALWFCVTWFKREAVLFR
jgi:sodium transport system permease protein